MSGKLNVYTIIDNPIFNEGIENLIKSKIFPDANVFREKALPLSNQKNVADSENNNDLLIYDVVKFSSKEFNQILQLITENPHFKILIITSNISISDVKLLFEIGVMGIINNNVKSDQFIEHVTKILEGNKILSREYWDLIIDYFFHSVGTTQSKSDNKSKNSNDVLLLSELTSREKEILGYICDGKSTREISEDLFLSLHTVETHRRKILNKMGVKNTACMVKMAIKCNLYSL